MSMKLKAIEIFRDKETGELHQVNGELFTDDIDRVNDLVRRGLAVIVSVESPAGEEPKAEKTEKAEKTVMVNGVEIVLSKVREAFVKIGVQVAANSGVDALNKKLSGLAPEQFDQLCEALGLTESKTEE